MKFNNKFLLQILLLIFSSSLLFCCSKKKTINESFERKYGREIQMMRQQRGADPMFGNSQTMYSKPPTKFEVDKKMAAIHRRPMLVAFTDPRACSPTGPTHFKCTRCRETFDSLLLGQEHANNSICTSDAIVNVSRSIQFYGYFIFSTKIFISNISVTKILPYRTKIFHIYNRIRKCIFSFYLKISIIHCHDFKFFEKPFTSLNMTIYEDINIQYRLVLLIESY